MSFIQKRILLVLIGATLAGGPAQAMENFEFYRGVRSLGMGGASIAVVNDETALIVNPAGLGKLRDFFGTIVDPEIDVNATARGTFLTGNTGALLDSDDLASYLLGNPDKYLYSRFQLFPSVVVRNFGLGGLYTNESYGKFNSETNTMDLMHRTDLSVLVGYNFNLWDGRLKLGVTGKYIQRQIVTVTDLDPSVTANPSQFEKEGAALGLDSGLILTAPWQMFPAMAIVVRDIGNTKFNFDSSDPATIPEAQVQRVDAGVSISPIHDNKLRSQWSLEYRDVLSSTELSGTDKLHFGTEFNYGDLLFLRAGWYQRYWTAGAELSTEIFQLQFATYAVNAGTGENALEDRRYSFKLGLRF